MTHTPSSVLTEGEFARATAPYVGREVAMPDLKAMLEAVNALYRGKGYVVCEARLAPQRIRGGRLMVTLDEGRTGRPRAGVSVTNRSVFGRRGGCAARPLKSSLRTGS